MIHWFRTNLLNLQLHIYSDSLKYYCLFAVMSISLCGIFWLLPPPWNSHWPIGEMEILRLSLSFTVNYQMERGGGGPCLRNHTTNSWQKTGCLQRYDSVSFCAGPHLLTYERKVVEQKKDAAIYDSWCHRPVFPTNPMPCMVECYPRACNQCTRQHIRPPLNQIT